MSSTTWQGRNGSVLLGPTQHRVATYLADLTRHGWIRLRTDELAARLDIERSEAYRILARLRVLGLFGVANDRGGHGGGRRVWRTPTPHDRPGLDPTRHRAAWARIRGAALSARRRVRARLHQMRLAGDPSVQPAGPVGACMPPAGPTFAERLRAAGMGALMDEWGVT